MIGLDLSGCVHKKRVKVRNKYNFTSCISYILLYFAFYHIHCIFFKILTPTENVEFHIHRSFGLSEVL